MQKNKSPTPLNADNLSKPQLRLWLKFKYGKGRTESGTAILKNYLNATGSDRKKVMNKLIKLAYRYRMNDLIWQARIYEHPGNQLIWDWKQYEEEK